MIITRTEVKTLTDEIEEEKKLKFLSPKAFEKLSIDIFKKTKSQISVSTLKRLWGYIDSRNKVRISTLDILSQYINYTNFVDFKQKKCDYNNSGYLTQETILSTNLNTGTLIEIGWYPDRLCNLLYEGNNEYSIKSALNTSLTVNKTFRILSFSLNKPLYLEIIEDAKIYIAGKNTGLTTLKILNAQ